MKQSPEQTKEISINASYYLMHINYAIKSKSQKNTGDVFPTSLTPATHWSDRKPYMQITEANPTWNPYHRQVIRLPLLRSCQLANWLTSTGEPPEPNKQALSKSDFKALELANHLENDLNIA